MKAEGYGVSELELSGWPVRITCYRIGEAWHATADNVSPGANIAKCRAATREAAIASVTEKAGRRLAATRRRTLEPGPRR